MSYDGSLRLLKRSFIGGGEGAFYFRMLDHLRALPHIDWLDIGIGRDGTALTPFVNQCRSRGQTLSIVGVDPDAHPIQTADGAVRWTLVQSAFERWTSTASFDVVNADQSLYYMENLPAQTRRIVAAMKPGGLLIATCWSREDTLHRVRERLFPEAASDLVGEDLERLFRTQPELELIDREEFQTHVDLASIMEHECLSRAAVRVIARGAACSDVNARVRKLLVILKDFPALAPRRNLAICCRRQSV